MYGLGLISVEILRVFLINTAGGCEKLIVGAIVLIVLTGGPGVEWLDDREGQQGELSTEIAATVATAATATRPAMSKTGL